MLVPRFFLTGGGFHFPVSASDFGIGSRKRRQFGDVAGNASSLIHRQHMGYVSIGFCLAPINVSERLAVSIEYLEAAWNLLDRPWGEEASHSIRCEPLDTFN